MRPRLAKETLGALASQNPDLDARLCRATAARLCDLDTVATRCPSFALFRGELSAILGR